MADAGLNELRELCTAAGDKESLALAMMGQLMELTIHAHRREAARLAAEFVTLLDSIGDPTRTVGLSFAAIFPLYEVGRVAEALSLSQQVIGLAGGDAAKGDLIFGSPLALVSALRGMLEYFLGRPGWREHLDEAVSMGRPFDTGTRVVTLMYKYLAIADGVLLPDPDALADTAEALRIAEEAGENFILALARLTRGIVLVYAGGAHRDKGLQLLGEVGAVTTAAQLLVGVETAREKTRVGDLDTAIRLARRIVERQFDTATMMWRGPAVTALVEALLRRGDEADVQEAQGAIERLAGVPTDPGFVLHELPLLRLRALLARARADDAGYRDLAGRYRAMATSLGFQGHIAAADAMC